MKKRILFSVVIILLMTMFISCGKDIDYSLPDQPLEFFTRSFTNPDDPDDEYISIEYKNRVYIPFGTLKKRINGNDVGDCLGYIVQSGVKMEDFRVFRVSEDTKTNYLIRIVTDSFMNQPEFFRAVDTVGKDIYTPDYIEELGYDFWS